MTEPLPILWSFRRCPYAMRARLAIRSAGIKVVLREIVLRNKPEAFLSVSQTKTVPVLVLPDGQVIEESRDIMLWALKTSHDPEGWLLPYHQDKQAVLDFFDHLEGPFKTDLDRYKYAARYAEKEADISKIQQHHRQRGCVFLNEIEQRLCEQPSLSGAQLGILDYGCLPFIRQFRLADMNWFDDQPWPHLHQWLARFLVSARFGDIMEKYPAWQPDQAPVFF